MCSHLSSALGPQKQNLTLTDFVRPTLLIVSYSTVHTATDGPSATCLLTVEEEQISSDKSVSSHLSSALNRQKQNLTLLDFIRTTPLTVSRNIVSTVTDNSSTTYLRRVETEEKRSDKPLSSQLSSALNRQKQNPTRTGLVRLTSLTVSQRTIPTATDGFSATHLCTSETEQIRSEKSARSHRSSALYRQKQDTRFLRLLILYVSERTSSLTFLLNRHTIFDFFLTSRRNYGQILFSSFGTSSGLNELPQPLKHPISLSHRKAALFTTVTSAQL